MKKVQEIKHAPLGDIEKSVLAEHVSHLVNLVIKIALEKATLVCERDRLLQEVIELKARPSSYAEAVKAKATRQHPVLGQQDRTGRSIPQGSTCFSSIRKERRGEATLL